MIAKDIRGNELLRVINVSEDKASTLYKPITHCLAVVMVGNEYLLGWNKWRENWEIFGGCIEKGETMRECIIRECLEEIGVKDEPIEYIGVTELNLCPDYFSSEYRKEYAGLYGISLPNDAMKKIEKDGLDRDEIEKISLLKNIKLDEKIAGIDKALLSFYGGESIMNSYEKIYEIVKQIPYGKVASYGQIAALAGNRRWSRVVGYALHVNPDEKGIPCYRVVTKDGFPSKAFAFGGENKQIERLASEGIEFIDGHVDMKKYRWDTPWIED